MISVDDIILQIVQGRLKNTIFIQRTTFIPNSKRHHDDNLADKNDQSSGEKPCLDGKDDEHPEEGDKAYVVDKMVQHNGFGSGLRHVVRSCGYRRADDTAKPPHLVPQHFIDACWRCSVKQKRRWPS